MRLVTVEDLKEGDILANDVLLEDYTVVLGKGTVIKEPYIDKLREIGIYTVYIEENSEIPIQPEAVKPSAEPAPEIKAKQSEAVKPVPPKPAPEVKAKQSEAAKPAPPKPAPEAKPKQTEAAKAATQKPASEDTYAIAQCKILAGSNRRQPNQNRKQHPKFRQRNLRRQNSRIQPKHHQRFRRKKRRQKELPRFRWRKSPYSGMMSRNRLKIK